MDERSIGANIRRLREDAGITLTDLAGQAELTKSTLSKIETGRVSSPISTLIRIASGLKVPLAQFFSEPEGNPRWVLTRKGHGRVITRDGTRFGYSYEALALEWREKHVEPFVLTVNPGDPPVKFRHGGDEFIYMLSGRMEFHVGDDAVRMAAGDALYFQPSLEHHIRVLGGKPVRFLCIFIQNQRPRRGKRSS